MRRSDTSYTRTARDDAWAMIRLIKEVMPAAIGIDYSLNFDTRITDFNWSEGGRRLRCSMKPHEIRDQLEGRAEPLEGVLVQGREVEASLPVFRSDWLDAEIKVQRSRQKDFRCDIETATPLGGMKGAQGMNTRSEDLDEKYRKPAAWVQLCPHCSEEIDWSGENGEGYCSCRGRIWGHKPPVAVTVAPGARRGNYNDEAHTHLIVPDPPDDE